MASVSGWPGASKTRPPWYERWPGGLRFELERTRKSGEKDSFIGTFNAWFDRFYHNTGSAHYSVPYEHPVYSQHTGMRRWLNGERWGFVAW